jgi:hypothetical protein
MGSGRGGSPLGAAQWLDFGYISAGLGNFANRVEPLIIRKHGAGGGSRTHTRGKPHRILSAVRSGRLMRNYAVVGGIMRDNKHFATPEFRPPCWSVLLCAVPVVRFWLEWTRLSSGPIFS